VQLVTDLGDLDALELDGWRLEPCDSEGVVMAYRMGDGKWRASHYYRVSELHRRNATRHSEMKDDVEWKAELECLAEDRLEHGLFKCKVEDGGRYLEARLRFDTTEDMQSFATALEERGFDPDTHVNDYGHHVLEVSRPLAGD
jgi:hypothetical protein